MSNSSPTVRSDVTDLAFLASLPIQSTPLTICPKPKHFVQPASFLQMPSGATLVPSTPLTRVQVSKALGSEQTTTAEQVDKVTSLQFQQAINCCGLTSVAYALSAIGCITTADDLFLVIGVDVESAVGDGMTLAEIYDASLRYINRTGIPVFVECYHFDRNAASQEGFERACDADADGGIDDILVLNFHAGLAHGLESGGGGHFSVMTALTPNSDDVIMADVHGIKYGAFWSTPVTQMYSAMTDKDSSGRARGALRFGRTDKQLNRPLPGLHPTLLDWTSPPAPFRGRHLQKYIPKKWDEGIGVRNMEGTCALASAMRVIGGDDSKLARLDEIMRALNESYTRQLNTFLSAEEISSMASKLGEKGLTKATSRVEKLSACDGRTLMETLRNLGCGEDGVVILVSYDFNEAHGAPVIGHETGEAGVLSHGTKTWSLLADFNRKADASDKGGVVIAPAHNVILAGRLWTTSADRLAIAMRSVNEHDCRVVVLDNR